jgi:acetylornithine deacetylase
MSVIESRDTSEVEALLIDLVQINSINPGLVSTGVGEAGVGSHVAAWARSAGLEVSVEPVEGERANVIVVARGTGGGRSMMLNAHLDTVGVEGYHEPFRCEVLPDRLTGRGVLDTKAGLAAALVIARDARRAGVRGDVVVAGVVDEEFGSIGTEALVASRRWKTDAAVVLEPTDMVMATDHRGFVWGEYHRARRGRARISSRSWCRCNRTRRSGVERCDSFANGACVSGVFCACWAGQRSRFADQRRCGAQLVPGHLPD